MRLKLIARSLLFALFLLSVSVATFAQIGVGISVGFGPPAIPVYEQPIAPAEGYLWTPGYWAWDGDDSDYYWVPGTWVEPPQVGFLWTPGYWGWGGGGYFFNEGYWGENVGWYGGINYGFGYFGHGFEGGRWDGGHFFYNRAVWNINVNEFHNVYNTAIVNRNESRVSFNGGTGGINERASAEEERYSHEQHVGPVGAQVQHVQEARGNRELRASVNQGKPPIAATQRAGSFSGANVVAAKEAGGHYEPPANRGGNNNANRPPATHAKEIAPYEKPALASTGNANQDKKYQQQQQKLYDKQNQQVQKMQQKQEQDHQRLAQQNANEQRKQQVEQKHQQQTQQLQQRHQQQQQQFQQHVQQQSRPSGGGGRPGKP